MKLFLFMVITLLLAAIICYSQQPSSQSLNETNYLLKSKHQKTAAWVLLAGGATLTTVGLIVGVNSAANELVQIITDEKDDGSFVAGEVMFAAGLASIIGSVPLFLASGRNKRKAGEVTLSMKIETVPIVKASLMNSYRYPAVSLRITVLNN